MPKATDWFVRHSTALCMGVGLLLLADSRVTNVLVPAPDPAFRRALQDDTPKAWREYVRDGGSLEKARVELSRHHAQAVAHLAEQGASRPHGLDPIFERLAGTGETLVYLEAAPLEVDTASFAAITLPDRPDVRVVEVAEHLSTGDWSCAQGLSDAFAAATGGQAIEVETPDGFDARPTRDAPRIHLEWGAKATGVLYGGGGKRLFPGFSVVASVRVTVGDVTLASFSATIDPPSTIEYTRWGIAPEMWDADHDDVARGMIVAACRRLGDRLLGELTGWTPPDPQAPDRSEACRRGDAGACLALGETLRATDPVRAREVLEQGCSPFGLHGGECCVAAAELALAHAEDPDRGTVEAKVLLDTGCRGHHAPACARAAELELTTADGGPPSDGAQADAYLARLRACDLRSTSACVAAAEQAASGSGQENATPSPVRARALFERSCVLGEPPACARAEALQAAAAEERTIDGVALGAGEAVFDVRWGMWWENTASEIVWVASPAGRHAVEQRLATEIAQLRARVYDPAALPPGLSPPVDAVTVYGLAREPPTGLGPRRACPDCTPRAHEPGSLWPVWCTCLP